MDPPSAAPSEPLEDSPADSPADYSWQTNVDANALLDDDVRDIDCIPDSLNWETALAKLRTIEVPLNKERKNVRGDDRQPVRSVTLGALSRSGQGQAKMSVQSRLRPLLTEMLARLGRMYLPPDFPFASIQLNKNYASPMHCDASNDGPSAIVALGDFTGGALWTSDRGVLQCHNELHLFNGNQPHVTEPFDGERLSLIYFSCGGHVRLAPEVALKLQSFGFRLPDSRLTHVFRAPEFAVPHLENPYCFGYHYSVEDRVADAIKAHENWMEDWAGLFDVAEAFKARTKPGEYCAEDVCKGLQCGYARLRSPHHRGDERDDHTLTATCPFGLRGPIEGVVMFTEFSRTTPSTVHPGKVGVQIFGVGYVDGRQEELELEEIAASLEPLRPGKGGPCISAPELARRQLGQSAAASVLIAASHSAEETKRVRYTAADSIIKRRQDSQEILLSRVEKHDCPSLLEAAAKVVQEGVSSKWWPRPSAESCLDRVVNVTRLVTRCVGGADKTNLDHFARAAGFFWFEDNRPPSSTGEMYEGEGLDIFRHLNDDCRSAALVLAVEARLEAFGFPGDCFLQKKKKILPSLNDICLEWEAREEKFVEFGPKTCGRERVVREILTLYGDYATSTEEHARRESPMLLRLLHRQLKVATAYTADPAAAARFGEVVWLPAALCRAGGPQARRDLNAPRKHLKTRMAASRALNDDEVNPAVVVGDRVRKKFISSGVCEGVVTREAKGPGVPRFEVAWDGDTRSKGPTMYTLEQLREMLMHIEDDSDDDEELWPAQLRDPLDELSALLVKQQSTTPATTITSPTTNNKRVSPRKTTPVLTSPTTPRTMTPRTPICMKNMTFPEVGVAELQFWFVVARDGFTSWARDQITRKACLGDSALRLAAPYNNSGRALTLAPSRQCRAWIDDDDEEHAEMMDEEDHNSARQEATRLAKVDFEKQRPKPSPSLPETPTSVGSLPGRRRRERPASYKAEDAGDDEESSDDERMGGQHEPARGLECQQENPKRVGTKSNARYEVYKKATTVGEYLALGGSRPDLAYDLNAGYVTWTKKQSAKKKTAKKTTPKRRKTTPTMLTEPPKSTGDDAKDEEMMGDNNPVIIKNPDFEAAAADDDAVAVVPPTTTATTAVVVVVVEEEDPFEAAVADDDDAVAIVVPPATTTTAYVEEDPTSQNIARKKTYITSKKRASGETTSAAAAGPAAVTTNPGGGQ